MANKLEFPSVKLKSPFWGNVQNRQLLQDVKVGSVLMLYSSHFLRHILIYLNTGSFATMNNLLNHVQQMEGNALCVSDIFTFLNSVEI